MPISFLFDAVDPVRAPAAPGGFNDQEDVIDNDLLWKPETVELTDAFFSIESRSAQKALLDLHTRYRV